jgi:hypothetical protein
LTKYEQTDFSHIHNALLPTEHALALLCPVCVVDIHHRPAFPKALNKKVPEVKAWEPAPKKKPQFSFLQKFWYELMDPVKLRAI